MIQRQQAGTKIYMEDIDINTITGADSTNVTITVTVASLTADQEAIITAANAIITQKQADLASFTTSTNALIATQQAIIAEAQAIINKISTPF